MTAMTLRQQKAALRHEAAWQKAMLGLLALSVLVSTVQAAWIAHLDAARREDAARYQAKIESAEQIRDKAVRELGSLVLQMDAEKEARAAQAAAYESMSGYRYIGECTITAYCPCEECCGQWADGLTSTGIPAVPGIVAVDPEVIPIGSTVIIDGQRYLAADTGVTGYCVDIAVAEHQEAVERGVSSAEVWVVASEGGFDE